MSSEKQDKPRPHIGAQLLERMPHHGGARHLAERADVRQARGAVAGLEQHLAFGPRFSSRFRSFLASSKGQALEFAASSAGVCAAAVMFVCFDSKG